MKKETKTKKLVISAIIAAIYAALTIILAPVSYGPIQLRVSEALCILPFFFPEASLGLFVGCILSNIYTGNIIDVIFGSFATLISGILTSKSKKPWIACLWPVLSNGIIIGAIIAFSYGAGHFVLCTAQIMASEAIVLYGIGLPLIKIIQRKLKK